MQNVTYNFKKISFTVDSALLRELGERLVGRAAIALGELVKNSYDADATECLIRISNGMLVVEDNGDGMSDEEFLSFWMRIGTRHKERRHLSYKFERPITGSKGIGRLAVQFLGSRMELTTRSRGGGDALEAKVDWANAVKTTELVRAGVMVRRTHEEPTFASRASHGTRIVVQGLKQKWTAKTVKDLARQIWMLQPPLEETAFADFIDSRNFRIRFETADAELEQEFKRQFRVVLDSWDAKIDGEVVNGRKSQRCTVRVQFSDGDRYKETIPLPGCSIDSVKFRILVFNLSGRIKGGLKVQDARDYFEEFGGVHVIDAGFRLPYYGIEHDWLDIEVDHARRMSTSKLLPESLQVPLGMRELPSIRRLFGRVAVDTGAERRKAPQVKGGKRVPHLEIQVTRDRLGDNEAYKSMKESVRASIEFYAMCVRRRRIKVIEKQILTIGDINEAARGLRTLLAEHEDSIPASLYSPISEHIDALEKAERLREHRSLKEKVLLGSLATAGIAAVAIEHEVSKQLVDLEELLSSLYGMASGREDAHLASRIDEFRNWIDRVRQTRQLFSPLMNESDREVRSRFRARKVVGLIVGHAHFVLREAEVDYSKIPESLFLPETTMAAWYAIFQNLLINAVNAMLDMPVKRIAISGGSESHEGWLLVQDTGVGVDPSDAEELFQPFVRRLQISEERRQLGLGGSGLGLTIVRMIAEAANCGVKFVHPEPTYSTAVRIEWPTA